jgi:hypothetical protein
MLTSQAPMIEQLACDVYARFNLKIITQVFINQGVVPIHICMMDDIQQ